MNIAQIVLKNIPEDFHLLGQLQGIDPQLVFVFGDVAHFADTSLAAELRQYFPEAQCVGCTTAGEISATGVTNRSTVVTAIRFAEAHFNVVTAQLESMETSFDAGVALARKLKSPTLKSVLLFGQGVHINGTALIDGLVSVLGNTIAVSGGLAGDNGAFSKTFTLSNQGISTNDIVAVGFEGNSLMFAHGSFGGWKPFGPTRKVTRCVGNILYELDGTPALDVYKRYLGEYAKDLPGSGLLFPFEMLTDLRESLGQIRTILGVNENDGSLIMAGAINPDGYLRLMHAHTNDLVSGAETAAQAVMDDIGAFSGQALALLVSCVGRKLVMGGRVDDEVEAVQEMLGSNTMLCGFYSNGEIAPAYKLQQCNLHNQTMTITYLAEKN
ncbi:FIST signal transduction protein [Undibacterium sp. SXout7W]|uniref:FIST signal transduction protein n=1 Tax=Undibacterium sp. SXout7W TaxID=3413049 RepID=UPI003BF0AA40